MKKQYEFAVFIGRFQPPHKAHIDIIKQSLEIADNVVVVLGSNRSAPNTKNPWTAEEREEMIMSCFPEFQHDNMISNYSSWYERGDTDDDYQDINFTSVRDYIYNDNIWIAELQQKIKEIVGNSKFVILVGAKKDKSSYYLDLFPQWDRKDFNVQKIGKGSVFLQNTISSTDIRRDYFSSKEFVVDTGRLPKGKAEQYIQQIMNKHHNKLVLINNETWIPAEIKIWLDNWRQKKIYEELKEEYEYYEDYKKQFSGTPFPVIFTTTDVVLIKSGHVLLVQRKVPPGKNLLALPGGFLNSNECLIDSAFRELREETRIKVDKKTLMEHIVEQRVFDHPDRSLRGRSITYAYYVKLPDGGELPEVKGGDDAKKALWMPIGDLGMNEQKFFEDHIHIIHHFINR